MVDVRRRTEESLHLVPVTRSSSREGWVCFQLTDRASHPTPPPNGEWPYCLSAARERKTPLFPWAEGPGEGVSLCLLSFVAWETQKRKVCLGGRSLVAWSVGDECLASWRGSSCVWGG